MNSSKKIERFELRLRPHLAAEAALLDSLEAREDVYGGKTELLRECVRRGYLALLETRAKLPTDASEDDILKAFAAEFSASGYSYRIGKLFLDAIGTVNNASAQSDDRPGEVAADSLTEVPVATSENAPATPLAPTPSEAGMPPVPPVTESAAQDEVPEQPQAVLKPQDEASATPAAPEAPEKDAPEGDKDEGSSEPESSARPRVNWGDRLGGLAGSRDGGTKKK